MRRVDYIKKKIAETKALADKLKQFLDGGKFSRDVRNKLTDRYNELIKQVDKLTKLL